jgi:ABC-type glycerol-3-phosphate transport system substrate-binding protein
MKKVFLVVILGIALMITTVAMGAVDLRGTEIYVAIRSLPETDFIISHTPEFTRQTGIKVHYLLYPELQLREKEVMDLASGQGAYDVIALDCVYVSEFAGKGWLVPLDNLLKPSYDTKDFMPKVLDLFRDSGKLYGLPVYSEITHLMYRKDIFAEKGIKVPTTFDELEQVAAKLNNPPQLYGIAMRGLRGDGMNVYIWASFFRGFGGEFFDKSWHPIFNNEVGVKATEYYANILSKYGPPGVSSYSWDDVQSAFTSGKTAMIIDANNFMTRIEDPSKSQIVGKIGYALIPAGPAGRFPGIYSMGLGVSAVGAKTEKEKLAAAEFVQWATSYDIQLDSALQLGVVSSARNKVFNNPAFIARFDDKSYPGWRSSTVESYKIAMPQFRPLIPEWREFGNLLGIAIEQVISGQKTAKEALDWAAEGTVKIMKDSGKLK